MKPPITARAAPVLALVLNALVWGLSWWPFRQLQDQGLHPLWSTCLIYLVSLACLLALRPRAAAGCKERPLLWLLALAAGLTNVCFNWAVTIGDVVRVVLLFYLMPAWSVLLAWLLLGEKPTAGAFARLLLALAGVALVLWTPGAGWPWPRTLADGLALAGGFCFALTNVLLLRLNQAPAESRALAMFGGGAVLAGTVAAIGTVQGALPAVPALAPATLLLALLLALGFLAGNLALQYGAARLMAHTTALVLLSEVVVAALSSVALGASRLAPGVLAGGLLVLAAAAWSAWPAAAPAPAGAQ
ncbi:MAG: putative transporter [Ramlibacter sp.]|uniref:EamA family transporter n=1 Tax=Ramlibacter sp. TaxID=1917967 RepID=UPI00260BAD9C|nr:EamA family transporter [Ramlibacter sp.]MDB5751792.1 putative transporter [Ramlibacter sp.]